MTSKAIIDLYDRHATDYDRERSRSLMEKRWLDRFLEYVPTGGAVLDIGCGMGEPVASYLLGLGIDVVGLDSSPRMIALCRERFPDAEWIVGDMRDVHLPRRFAGLIAWDSFFHLTMDDQRAMFERFAGHARAGAPLMFTSGGSECESVGSWCGEPLYHASLDAGEYRRLLADHGFTVQAHQQDDATCGGHTIWLATYEPATSSRS